MGKNRGARKKKRDERWDDPIVKENRAFEEYYQKQGIVPDSEWDDFVTAMRRPLPTTFRITGNKSHAVDIRNSLQTHYFPALTALTYEGEPVRPPIPLRWYPDSLAWQITVRKEVIRKDPSFRKFQHFLVCECEAGNISRQEAVSMIPPLLLDIRPHHKIIDLCAAPGSKTAQILEALNGSEVSDGALAKSPTGLVIANDNDYKRCYLMIHQLNRIPSSTYMATSYDASQFPNLRVPGSNGRDEIIKFDRVLADVPCSGDGTMRKNPAIWMTWANQSAIALHPLQTRILYRGLQMLGVGGRLVYSTCSMNPLENEAVVAEALRMAGDAVQVIDVSKELSELIRRPGMQSWKILDGNGEDMERDALERGGKITTSMFPPTDKEEAIKAQLARCIRVYPHLQDTGGFFISVMEKKCPLGKKVDMPAPAAIASETNGHNKTNSLKRSGNDTDPSEQPVKKPKFDPIESTPSTRDRKAIAGNEEPFNFIPPSHPELTLIRTFFNLSPHFPMTDLFVRNSTGEPLHAIYIASPLVQAIIRRNPALRLLNAGTRLFVRQPDTKGHAKCLWRIHSDGLSLIDAFLGPERVIGAKVDEIRGILKENAQFPLIKDVDERLRNKISALGNGGFILRVDPSTSEATDMNVPFSLPMWKSPHAINVMIQKMDRKALTARLYYDTDGIVEEDKTDGNEEMAIESFIIPTKIIPAMPKKFGENTKKAAGNAKKAAAHEARIAKQQEHEEREEAANWSKGAKSNTKAEAEEAKKAAQAAKKAELKALEAAERASLPSKPAAKARGDEKKAAKRADNIDDLFAPKREVGYALTASNIDDALDALSLTQGGEGEARKALVGIDRHPERRQKAALAVFEDRRLPELRKEHPGLRLQQYKDIIYKEFQKSPENPFNQVHAAHNATRDEIREIAAAEKRKIEQRLAEKG